MLGRHGWVKFCSIHFMQPRLRSCNFCYLPSNLVFITPGGCIDVVHHYIVHCRLVPFRVSVMQLPQGTKHPACTCMYTPQPTPFLEQMLQTNTKLTKLTSLCRRVHGHAEGACACRTLLISMPYFETNRDRIQLLTLCSIFLEQL